jgi:hypothetical protein
MENTFVSSQTDPATPIQRFKGYTLEQAIKKAGGLGGYLKMKLIYLNSTKTYFGYSTSHDWFLEWTCFVYSN